MHTTDLARGWIAIHNGDYSGDIQFYEREDDDEPVAEIPFDVIVELVAEAVRKSAIGRLEDATIAELIAGLDPLYLHGGPEADKTRSVARAEGGLANAPRCTYCDMPTVVDGVCRSCSYDVGNVNGGQCVEGNVGTGTRSRCHNDMLLGTSQHCVDHQRKHYLVQLKDEDGDCEVCGLPADGPIHMRVVVKSEERTPMTEAEAAVEKRRRRRSEAEG